MKTHLPAAAHPPQTEAEKMTTPEPAAGRKTAQKPAQGTPPVLMAVQGKQEPMPALTAVPGPAQELTAVLTQAPVQAQKPAAAPQAAQKLMIQRPEAALAKVPANSGQNSGQDSSDTDSDVESGSETDYDTDSDSSGQSEEYRRRPFIGDPNNIPYAPGISAPTLIIPDTDPFAGISAPLMDIDPTMPLTVPSNVLVPRPGTPQYTTSSLPNIETILGEGEYPAGYTQAANYTGTNEQLIAAQNIVSGLSLLSDGFRFYTVDKDLAVSPAAQSVYEEMNNTSREVGLLSDNDALYVLEASSAAREIGRLSTGGICYIIQQVDDHWLYVESGNVRGFVPAAYVLRGAEAQQAVSALQPSGTDNSVQTGSFTDEDTNLNFAVETIPAGENSAFTYMRCTTKSTVIDKQYAVADQDLPILEEASSAAREIGSLLRGP